MAVSGLARRRTRAAAKPRRLGSPAGVRRLEEVSASAGHRSRIVARPVGRLATAMESKPINIADYERIAAERLDAGPLAYFGGGAGDEFTMRENVAAYRRWALRPRVLVDVEEATTATTVLG